MLTGARTPTSGWATQLAGRRSVHKFIASVLAFDVGDAVLRLYGLRLAIV